MVAEKDGNNVCSGAHGDTWRLYCCGVKGSDFETPLGPAKMQRCGSSSSGCPGVTQRDLAPVGDIVVLGCGGGERFHGALAALCLVGWRFECRWRAIAEDLMGCSSTVERLLRMD
jgi:hypothetical protein